MAVDSSGVTAILRPEPGCERLQQMLLGTEIAVMSAAVVVEASTVIGAVALLPA